MAAEEEEEEGEARANGEPRAQGQEEEEAAEKDLEQDSFDVVVLGTGITESIVAAYVALRLERRAAPRRRRRRRWRATD